ncbi:DUF6111 family protein [Stappia sp.]|uniref:DUF6111 family protein n=1 Tax=Stappia sp. TaxID=1870903 RepID=UPI0032D9245F
MLRIILTQLFLFLLPFVGYAIWLFINKKAQTSENWRNGPIVWLVIAGLGLGVIFLVTLATREGVPEGQWIKPTEFRDGELVPGHYE